MQYRPALPAAAVLALAACGGTGTQNNSDRLAGLSANTSAYRGGAAAPNVGNAVTNIGSGVTGGNGTVTGTGRYANSGAPKSGPGPPTTGRPPPPPATSLRPDHLALCCFACSAP